MDTVVKEREGDMLRWEDQDGSQVTVSLNKPDIAKPVSSERVNLTQL